MKKLIVTSLSIIGGIVVVLFLALLLGALFFGGEKSIPAKVVLELNLERPLVEYVPDDPLAQLMRKQHLALRDVTDALQVARTDERVVGLVARIGGGPFGMAQVQELRDAVAALRAAGKFTVAHGETFGEGGSGHYGYYLATAFDEVLLQASGDVNLAGLRAESMFLRGLLDKVGVVPRLDHRKEFKNAMNTFTEKQYTAAHREATRAIVDSMFAQLVDGIAERRGMDAAALRGIIDRGPYPGPEAQRLGLVDGLAYRDQVIEALDEKAGETLPRLTVQDYLQRAGRPHRRGKQAVALIYGIGPVLRGASEYNPGMGTTTMGSASIGAAFRDAVADPTVKAIVFRIDSPGGSYVASDTIWRETVQARAAGKPVVVSMGNVAGSGGYFIAASADAIVAQPGTLTGSIGVVSGKMLTGGLWDKLGISWDSLQTSDNADIWSSLSDYDEAQWRQFQAQLDRVYEDFTRKVADGRGLSIDAVQNVAKGRVWTGADALRHKLVDQLGGLETAIDLARAAGGIETGEPFRLALYPRPRGWLEALQDTSAPGGLSPADAALIKALQTLEPVALAMSRAGLGPAPGVLTMPAVPH